MSARGWPASLVHGGVGVRPPRGRDAVPWSRVRVRNAAWLTRWEGRAPHGPVTPWEERNSPSVFTATLRSQRREARAGRLLPFVVTLDDRLVGGITVGGVTRGAFDSAHVGYWVDEAVAGRGVTTTALALVLDHCFGPVGLHRVEANVRPENAPSLRVLDKLGFTAEGRHRRYLFIDEAWRDHLAYALLAEDAPGGVLRALVGRSTAEGRRADGR